MRQIWTQIDTSNLQSDVEALYKWVETNNMELNGDKFECVKVGDNEDLKTIYNNITPG